MTADLPALPRCSTCSDRDLTHLHDEFCPRCRYALDQLGRPGVVTVSKEGEVRETGLFKTVTDGNTL